MELASIGPREAVAVYLGEDFAELPQREYQPGMHGATKVYTYGPTSYVFALPVNVRPSRTVRAAFDGCTIAPAVGGTADYIRTRGKRIWIITQGEKA